MRVKVRDRPSITYPSWFPESPLLIHTQHHRALLQYSTTLPLFSTALHNTVHIVVLQTSFTKTFYYYSSTITTTTVILLLTQSTDQNITSICMYATTTRIHPRHHQLAFTRDITATPLARIHPRHNPESSSSTSQIQTSQKQQQQQNQHYNIVQCRIIPCHCRS